MSVFRHILTLFILYSAITLALLPESKMKKVRVNIAPKLGIKDRDVYIDVRFDADNKIGITQSLSQHSLTSGKGFQIESEAISECIERNCHSVQEALGKEGITGRWRANISIMDRIIEHYKGVNDVK